MNPLNLIPAPYRLALGALAVALVLASCYALGRSHGAGAVRAEWNAEKLELAQAAIEADRLARETEQALNRKIQEAQRAATIREKTIRAAADSARSAADGLRDDLAAVRRRLSGDSLEACRRTADAALAVFGECADRYRDVAAAADGHHSDAVTLSDAWPK